MATIRSTIELVDKMSSKLADIESNINSMKSTLSSVSDEQSKIDGFSWNTFITNAEAAGKKIAKIGNEMTLGLTAPLLMLGKKMYGTATDYESAFAGVKKTTEATEEEYDALYEGLLQIAETNPTNFVNAAGIMEMAGQLGVTKEELLGFTQAYIGLQESTNIGGEEGAADIARFLNVTEKSTANIERVGGVIVGLGNNFATTEQEILAMATRMGATADLAGFSSAEILAFSAALSSVGINAEAGGSAAGKLMKKMQLAAEVGGTAQERLAAAGYNFESGLDFVNALSSMKGGDKAVIADKLGMTVDSLQNLGDSWYLMEQFSQVMGVSGEDFLKGWNESSAQSMLTFFKGLGNLDPEAGNSVLAQLAEMDITEIRLSNLVAAMAGNADLFQAALTEAYKQYNMDTGTNAMAEEVAKRYETQESQNAMLGNKLENTMADFGQNLVQALQPALDMVNDILNAFNSLSESDQTTLLATLGGIAIIGPGLSVAGKAIEGIAKLSKLAGKAKGIGDVFSEISGFLIGTPVGNALLLAGAVTGIAAALDSIPDRFEILQQGVKDIPITIDDASYNETLNKISQVQEALNGLKPGEIKQEYENTAIAVQYGYGTNEMFGTALAYEAAKANANINETASNYAVQMAEAEKEIADAATRGDTSAAEAARTKYDGLRSEMDSQLSQMRRTYTERISALFSGMASQYPEAAEQLTKAASDYDLMSAVLQAQSVTIDQFDDPDTFQLAKNEAVKQAFEAAWNAGFIDTEQFGSLDNLKRLVDDGQLQIDSMLSDLLYNSSESLQNAVQSVSDNPILASWLQAIVNNPNLTENMDVTQLSGALEGIFKALDFKNALNQSKNPSEWGKYLSEGLGQGISENASLATRAGTSLGTDTITNVKAALGVASPSTFMIEAGLNVVQGLQEGIANNADMASTAASAMASGSVAVVVSTLNPGVASSIGLMFDFGLASGIRAGASSVISAAIAVATAALNGAKGALGIHSPSRETYYQGEMLIKGYTNAIQDGSGALNRSIGNVLDESQTTWNNGVWNMIAGFAETEQQALQDEFNHVKDGVKINESDLKKIRTLAEREVINKFTTAEVKVEMTNNNNIKTEADIDSLIAKLEDKVTERLEAVAEGVYS